MQPTHATSDMPWAPTRIGAARIEEGAYVWRKLLDAGAVLASGSDFPVEEANPMLGFYAAITRQDSSGNPAGRLDAAPAHDARRGARLVYDARSICGTCRDADRIDRIGEVCRLVVLSKDIMRVPAREIPTTVVRMTIVGGEIVYQAP